MSAKVNIIRKLQYNIQNVEVDKIPNLMLRMLCDYISVIITSTTSSV